MRHFRVDSTQSAEWLSITTSSLAATAVECYRRESRWQASAYCTSPVNDVLQVVWASCFGEEQALLLAAIEDSKDDTVGIQYLSTIEENSREEISGMIGEIQTTSPRCTGS